MGIKGRWPTEDEARALLDSSPRWQRLYSGMWSHEGHTVTDRNAILLAQIRIALELRHQYSVGYIPKDFQPDGKWRKLKFKVIPPRGMPHLTVRGRYGYYSVPNSSVR